MKAIFKYPVTDLTKLKMKKVEDLTDAINSIYAQINKWLLDKEGYAYNINSILMNKLVYYISEEVNKVNEKFIMNRGWYMYGPCYEDGRRFEYEETPITIKPVSEGVSFEIKVVCNELIPHFRECESKGTVMTDFLRYIYTEKCNEPDFRDYYLTKHEMLCILYRFNHPTHDITQEDKSEIHEREIDFEKVFHVGDYNSLVGLTEEETEDITEFWGLLCEYLNLEMELERPVSISVMKDIFNVNRNVLLTALSYLNYAKTFTSFNPKYQKDLRRDHSKRGHQILKFLKEENRRISKSIFELTYGER